MSSSKYGLIAGNGKFPFLVLEAARSQGIDMVVAAIKEETFPEIEQHGVGMCQVGAYGMALDGATYEQILKKYYKGIELKKMY